MTAWWVGLGSVRSQLSFGAIAMALWIQAERILRGADYLSSSRSFVWPGRCPAEFWDTLCPGEAQGFKMASCFRYKLLRMFPEKLQNWHWQEAAPCLSLSSFPHRRRYPVLWQSSEVLRSTDLKGEEYADPIPFCTGRRQFWCNEWVNLLFISRVGKRMDRMIDGQGDFSWGEQREAVVCYHSMA